jgi:predicted metalloendopeptidase
MSLSKKVRKYHKKSSKQTKKHRVSSGAGHDFYQFVNQSWLANTNIPETKVAYGVSEEIERRIETQTQEILKEAKQLAKHSVPSEYKQTLQHMIGLLAMSVETADTQGNNLETVKQILSSIQSLQNQEEVAVVLGEFNRYKLRNLLHIYGQYENKNDTNFSFTIGIGGLGLPDASFYHKKSMHRSTYYAAYKRMITRLGNLFGLPNLKCVLSLERILAGVLLKTEYESIEHKRKGAELEKEFPQIPFSVLFETIGLSNWRTRIFFVESLRWMHTINKLFHHLGLDYWKLLLSLEFLLFALPWLPPTYFNLSFGFYRNLLRGQSKQVPRSKQAIYAVQSFAAPFFSQIYKDKLVDTSIKPKIETLVQDCLQIAQERLSTVEWLEPKTRVKAQEKVQKMKMAVAYPDSFETFSIPKLSEDNVISNLLILGEWQMNHDIQKLGQPLSKRKDWDDALYVVNAYYYEQANEMIIPSGILQPPFYDANASMAWNLGGIGCIICHELTHAFDKEGKEYNPEGLQEKWWTALDNRRYNEQAKSVIDLYGKQSVAGFPVSGKKTLSENIADIGGMGIALDVLKHKLDELRLTQKERHEAYRDFFTSYAISWRVKEKKKKRIQALIMDKHAPPSLRVNLVVSQFQEWYDAFEITPKDKLYLSPEKRIRIF